jgi:hypothetical protein
VGTPLTQPIGAFAESSRQRTRRRAREHPVTFGRIRVKYLRGASEDISVRSEIQDGGKTRRIDLPGENRVIESVSMWYSKRNWRSRPTVRVYGIR